MNLKDKIIAFDLDGTLAGADANVSKYSREILSKLVKEGYNITLITGRQWTSTKAQYEGCNLNLPCVLGNGTLVYNPSKDKIVFDLPLDRKFIFDLIDNKEFLDIIQEIAFEHELDTYYLKRKDKAEHAICGNFHDTIDCNPTSMIVWANDASLCPKVKEIIEKTNPRYTFRYWGAFGEIYNKHFSKKDGAEIFLKKIGKTFDDLIFFGDAENDVELLEAANIGICMKNGDENTKKHANMITDYYHYEDGAVKFLLKLIKEGNND